MTAQTLLPGYLTAPSLRDLLWQRFAEQPGLPALHVEQPVHGEGRWLTYGELGRAVNRTAHALAAAGAAPGARVGVMLPNGGRCDRGGG